MKILRSLDSNLILRIFVLNVAVGILSQTKAGNRTLANHLHVLLTHVQALLEIKVLE